MAVGFVVALLVIRIDPVAAPAVVGLNVTCSTADCPGFSVIGKFAAIIVNPVPVNVAELIVSGDVPDEVSVTDWLVGVLTVTSPKARLVVLRLRIIVCAFSCSVKVFVLPPADAVSVAVVADVTAETAALNAAVVAPAATVTEAGTATDALLLDKVTASPPAGAAALSVTVHASVDAPVSVRLVQERELSAPAVASPFPLRLIAIVPLVVALLTTVIVPVAAPAVVGSKLTCSVTLCPGFSVTGNVAPVIPKPVPVSVPLLIVTGDEPDDVSVTACVLVVFRFTSPKLSVVVLTLKPGA